MGHQFLVGGWVIFFINLISCPLEPWQLNLFSFYFLIEV